MAVRLRSGLPVSAQGFGGWPGLVHEGRVVVSQPCGPLTCALHPRTAVGLTQACFDRAATTRCRFLVVVVDGRRLGWSVGMTTHDLAEAFARLGAYEAINLDGGASSQVLFHGRSLNRVAPGARRAVVSALIMRRRPVAAFPGVRPIARW